MNRSEDLGGFGLSARRQNCDAKYEREDRELKNS